MKSILLIEDDPDIRLLVEVSLNFRGFTVVSCENGAQGIEKARLNDVQLVLLDVMLPDMSGFEVLEVLRADQKTMQLPVVLLSASSSEREVARAADFGIVKFIPKPFDPVTLGIDIAQLLEGVTDDDSY